ncbi:MAG: ABC transporter ATP-binding protein [Saprospirales bacterium]|nr:ABC transporter ATP-binding protein [Saprospirales bacterium]
MSDTIIKVENVSKQYRLGEIGTGSLSHDLNRWWSRLRGKEDPYLKIGETNDRTQKGSSDYVWALRDINFEINRGEVWGVIGKNGAGKSTLLKLLSKVTSPTIGEIKYKGKMASLLEVGTGFHGELTGRENVYLNGAILGMKKKEISSKIDEIIDFAGVEKYIDTPVKRYSSGMYVRLAFAVAAHLDTDILILDEVLAVGDASFQRKCLGKMNDAASNQGKTVLFVSHNLSQVQGLCKKGMLLENGHLTFAGDISTAISKYTLSGNTNNLVNVSAIPRVGPRADYFQITKLQLRNLNNNEEYFEVDTIELTITFESKRQIEDCVIAFSISDSLGNILIDCRSTENYPKIEVLPNKQYTIRCELPLPIKSGSYQINLGAASFYGILEYVPSVTNIELLSKDTEDNNALYKPSVGMTIMHPKWQLINN